MFLEQTASFAPTLDGVADARRFARRALRAWDLGQHEAVEAALSLLVTELATNAVLHARTEYAVTVAFDGIQVHLRVADRSARLLAVVPHTKEATTGRGLRLVAAYADEWGVAVHDGGKTVWCVLRAAEEPLAEPGSSRAATAVRRRGRPATSRNRARRDNARAVHAETPPWPA